MQRPPPQVCRFYLAGTCHKGKDCRFSHEVPPGGQQRPPPPPMRPQFQPPPPSQYASNYPFHMQPMGTALPPAGMPRHFQPPPPPLPPAPPPPLPPGPPPPKAYHQPPPPRGAPPPRAAPPTTTTPTPPAAPPAPAAPPLPAAPPSDAAGADGRPPCSFFAKGKCREGQSCRFSHALAPAGGAAAPKPAPPPTVVSLPAGAPLFSIDVWSAESAARARGPCLLPAGPHLPVRACPFRAQCTTAQATAVRACPFRAQCTTAQATASCAAGAPQVECVATGVQHHDRAVAQISLVDSGCAEKLNLYVKPDVPVASYLSPLTGLTAEHLETHGVPLAQAIASLTASLPPNAVLVGQNILKDVEWLGLVEGKVHARVHVHVHVLCTCMCLTRAACCACAGAQHFGSMIDLAALLRVWNPRFGSYTFFGQDHYAAVWLGVQVGMRTCTPCTHTKVIHMCMYMLHMHMCIQLTHACACGRAGSAPRPTRTTPSPTPSCRCGCSKPTRP